MREKTLVMPEELAALATTPDTSDTSAVSTMVAPDAAPLTDAKQRALEKHFTPAQLDALKKTKDADPAPAPTVKAKTKAAPAAKVEAAPEPSALAPDEIVVDFSSQDETETDPSSEDPAATGDPDLPTLSEDELKGLDEKARKSYLDAHKENVKVRKRAQAAEQEAADLKARVADLTAAATRQGDQLPAELNAANSLAHVQQDNVLDLYKADAHNVLAILRQMANGDEVETSYRSQVDGKVYEIDHTYAAWAAGTIVDVEGRRKQLTVLKKAQDKATQIEARLKDTPGFSDALKTVTGQALVTEWPQRRVEAAIGSLVTSGQYRLIKISKGTAAGATSLAAVTAPTPKKAPTSSPTHPQREPRGTMPSGSPEGGEGVSTARLSQLEQQAMKTGHPDDVKALMAAKMALRQARRSRA